MRRRRTVTPYLAPLALALSLAAPARAEPPARPRVLRVEVAPASTARDPDKGGRKPAGVAADPKARADRAPVQSAGEPAKGATKQADGAVTPGASEKAGTAHAPLTTAEEGKAARPDKAGGQRAEQGGTPADKGRETAVKTATASDKVRAVPTTRTASAPDKGAEAATRGAERPSAPALSTADSPPSRRAAAGRPREQSR